MKLKLINAKILSFLLVLVMMLGMLPTTLVRAEEIPAGYVTMSFVDYGIRVEDEEVDFPDQLGVIIEPTQVPFYAGENIAQVTLRLLQSKGIDFEYTGKPEQGFYLSNIKGFTTEDGQYVETFGEFDSGACSGWMISWNNWFINMGASEFQVEDGDIVKWQNTCQLGADIGCDWSNGSAEITGLVFKENYGTLSPEFANEVENYTYTIPTDVNTIQFEATQENYWSPLTYKVGDVSYKPYQPIPVDNGTVIDLYCAFSEYYGNPPTDEDFIHINIVKENIGTDPNSIDNPEEVKQGEGLTDLLIYTGSSSTMDSTSILGPKNENYPDRVIFSQTNKNYIFNDSDAKIKTNIRFAPVVAETNSTVKVYYGDNLEQVKVLKAVETSNSYVGTNWASVLTKAGKNKFTIVVTPPEGSSSRETTYTFTYYGKPSLTDIEVKEGDKALYLNPKFGNTVTDYSIDISKETKSLYLNAVPKFSEYRVTYNGSTSNNIDVSNIDKINIDISMDTGDKTLSNTYVVNLNKLQDYQAIFDVTPAIANVAFYDAQGERVDTNQGGTYSKLLPGTDYTYVVTAYGYKSQTGIVSGPESLTDGHLKIDLQTADKNTPALPNYTGEWVNFRNSDDNMGITDAKTPITEDTTNLKWAVKYGTGWAAAPTPPIIVDGYLYIAVASNILKLDKNTGEEVARSPQMAGNVGYALNPITYAEGMLFVPVGLGRVQALRADTLDLLWVSEKLGGQTLCPITYHDGYIYTGTWNSELKVGTYFALSVTDEEPSKSDETKLCTWKLNHVGGFYWAGAYVTDDYLVVGSDDGAYEGDYVNNAVLYSVNPKTGEVIDTISGIKGDIRSAVSYDKKTDRVYFSTKGGWFYSVKVNNDGTFNKTSIKFLETGGMSTGTPLVFNGRAYLGVSGPAQFSPTGHSYQIIDVETMTKIYSVEIPGYVQTSALLSTAYYEKTGKVYVYVTYNYLPGGVYVIEDSAGQTEAKGYHLFVPTGNLSQYCICSVVCDADGTIYYKNDSCFLMALERYLYSMSFNLNGGTLEGITDNSKVVYKETDMGNKLGIPKKEGCIFRGWFATPDFAGPTYEVLAEDMSSLGNLYAKWETNVDKVIKLINLIKEGDSFELSINNARNAYNLLSEDEKLQVSNYDSLVVFEAQLAELNRVKVQSVELNLNTLNLDVNESYKLKAIVKPDSAQIKEVTYESSNSKVAIVDNAGNVKGISAGKAVITVTSKDQGKQDTCNVTVSTPIINPPIIIPPNPPEVVTPPVVPEEKPDTEKEDDKKEDNVAIVEKVENPKVSNTATKAVKINWEKQENASGYRIYQHTNAGKKVVATISKNINEYVIKNLKEGTSYEFSIRAFVENEDGEKEWAESSKTLKVTTSISTPQTVKTKGSENKVTVSFKKVSSASGYEVYMTDSKNSKYRKIKTIKGNKNTTYSKTNLKSKKSYYIKVRSYKVVNNKKVYSKFSKVEVVKTK